MKLLCRGNLLICCLLISLCTSQSSDAEEYYWRMHSFNYNYNLSTVDHFSSAVLVCAALANDSKIYGGWAKAGVYTYSPLALDYGNCLIKFKAANGSPQTTTSTILINRYGSSCSIFSNSNPTTGACDKDEQKGPPEKTCAGNPINFAIGNKFQTEADYSASSSSLSFVRSYNSLDGLWRHSFSTYLRFAGTQYVSVVMRHGRESFFTISGTTVTPTSADLGVLTKTGTTGWQYVSTVNERFTFNAAGKLTQWSDAHSAVQQFSYSGNQVTVTDNLGNSLSFTEDADHQPLTLSAPGVQIAYGYNTNKRLTSVTRVTGGQTTQRQFHYEVAGKPDLLTGITDERGVRYATWTYDDQGRATSSEHAGGADHVGVAYNSDGTVSVTNELGKVAKYSFQYIKGVRRITLIQGEPSANCPNSNSSFTYDTNGLLKTKTDNKGYLTTYIYNARGLEISRTEASGTAQARTITTDWHPTLFLPLTVTEFGKVTQYQYDSLGRKLSYSVDVH